MHPGAGAQDKAFALLCVQGNTRGSGDKSLERAFQSLSLKHHLESMHAAAEGSQMAFLPGAGATYMSGCDYALVENRWMAIFVGCDLHKPTQTVSIPALHGHVLLCC